MSGNYGRILKINLACEPVRVREHQRSSAFICGLQGSVLCNHKIR